ncbi:hypothetical protein KC315_g6234 [Hortaea werneckii]|nr:hypothetical protein KC315_g6234 [Hortaea werneckii]
MAGRPEPPPSTPDKYPTNFLLDDIVTLEIGRKSKTIQVHRGVLSFYSGYFRAALDGNFAEASKGVIKLSTEKFDVVELAVTWMYVRKLDVDFEGKYFFDTGLLLCELWTFADRRQIPLLANVAIDHLRSHHLMHWYAPSLEMIRYSYANTPANAALRRFMVFFLTVIGSSHIFKKIGGDFEWPQEAIWDLLMAVSGDRDDGAYQHKHYPVTVDTKVKHQKKIIQDVNMCKYHIHDSGVSCKITGQKRSRSDPEELPAGKASKKK